MVGDGSEPLEVLLGFDVGFAADGLLPGARMDVAGLLVYAPAAARWILGSRAPGYVVTAK